jgi:hypothetical protein
MAVVRVRARVLVVAAIFVVALAGAAPVRAEVTHHPQGAFAIFSGCPLNNPLLLKCMVATTAGGELRLGNMVVPITRTFEALRGGFGEEAADGMRPFLPPEGGVPIQRTPLSVPGGLSGVLEPSLLPSSLRAAFDKLTDAGLGGLTATMELAGPNSTISLSTFNVLLEEGVALEEPVKLKLTNPFLGEQCFIGSAADPIVVQTTTGTTSPPPPDKPIEGHAGFSDLINKNEIVVLTDNVEVGDSFAVPAASGCGGSLAPLIDRAIDAKIGLPSPAGRNTAILDNTIEQATPWSVIQSE